ncbi:MAG: amino acid permease [Phycisphaerae bacterium]|nr:amino acid permease [Phycisphaerae bacterium]
MDAPGGHGLPSGGAIGEGVGVPARVLGTLDASCIVIGAIIGVGIFFSPWKVASLTESAGLALLAWVVGGAMALCGAVAFAEIGRRYHASGAQYQALRDGWGGLGAFVFVVCNATAIQAGAAAIIAAICAANLLAMVGGEGRGAPPPEATMTIACALIALVTVANVLGVRWGARLQVVTVFAKVAALLAIVALAAVAAPRVPPAPTGPARGEALPGLSGVIAALAPAFFAYGGWQHALWIAGEVREPRRTLPRAIVGGVAVVVGVYVLANWAYLALLGREGVATSTALAADAVSAALPGWGRRAVAGAVALSALGVLNAQLLSGPRLVYGMAADGRFFPPFGRLSARWGTPVAAIVMIGVLGIGLLLAAGVDRADKIVTGVVFIDGVFFVLTAGVILKGSWGAWARGEGGGMIRGARAAAAVFIVGEGALLAGSLMDPSTREAVLIGVGWMIGAAALYAARFRRAG